MASTLAELRANPGDRALRLVYADWLANQGHPRGELIAVQDAEDHSASAEQFAEARARAIALIDAHPQLRPDLHGLGGDRHGGWPPTGPQVWAQWRGGYIERLELVIDDPGPRSREGLRAGEGLRGWSKLLARWLAHPSLAFLSELLVRVDLRGEPVDETEAALAIVREGLAPWLAEPEPKPPLRLTLATARVPRPDARERLREALAPLAPRWVSSDRTLYPPPSTSPIIALDEALVRVPVARGGYELLWFDAAGHALDRFGDWAPDTGWLSVVSTRAWSVAEELAGGELAHADPLPLRRITRVLERLAPRLDGGRQPFAPGPVPEPRPQALALDELVARMRAVWTLDPRPLVPALARFHGLRWHWLDARSHARPWTGLCGLGDDQVLVVAYAPAPG